MHYSQPLIRVNFFKFKEYKPFESTYGFIFHEGVSMGSCVVILQNNESVSIVLSSQSSMYVHDSTKAYFMVSTMNGIARNP